MSQSKVHFLVPGVLVMKVYHHKEVNFVIPGRRV